MSVEKKAQLAQQLTQLAREIESPATNPYFQAIDQFRTVMELSAELEAQAVRTAHDMGYSWSKIGAHLGISRQAVQQRFDPTYQSGLDDELRRLGPVTRDEELHHLNTAGEEGWRLVHSLPSWHFMRYDAHRFEVIRVSLLTPVKLPSEKAGWEAATIRFPDCFYTRKIGEL